MYVFVYYMDDDDDDDDDDDVEVASLSPLPAARREAHFSGAVNWAGHEFGWWSARERCQVARI